MSSISSISSSSPSASAGSIPSVAILASKVAAVDIESVTSPKKIVLPPTNVSIDSDHDVEVTKVAAAVDFSTATIADVVLSDDATTPWKRFNKKKKGPIDQSYLSRLVSVRQVTTSDITTDCLRRFCARERILGMGSKTKKPIVDAIINQKIYPPKELPKIR